MNDLDMIGAPKIWKPEYRIRKLGRSDTEWSKPCGDQITHFVNCTESSNVENSSYNYKKTWTTLNEGSTICVLFVNKRKPQVGWVITIGWRTWK
jgi:hypothetical protein